MNEITSSEYLIDSYVQCQCKFLKYIYYTYKYKVWQ